MRETVCLHADARLLAGTGSVGDEPNLFDESLPEAERRDEELPEVRGSPEARQVVEEIGDVRRDVRVGGEEPEVLVRARGDAVVVPRAEMNVAAEAAPFTPHHKRRLPMGPSAGGFLHDVPSRLLECAGPLDGAA